MNAGVVLSPAHKELAKQLADISFARYRNAPGHYHNLLNSHLVGRLGEFAAFTWLRDNGFNPTINTGTKGGDRLADISTDFGRCEVKTWSAKHWDQYGRCVSVSQLASIRKKADFIFWCVADETDTDEPVVHFKGWCSVNVLDKNPATLMGVITRQVLNHQLAQEDLHELSTLKQGAMNGQESNS